MASQDEGQSRPVLPALGADTGAARIPGAADTTAYKPNDVRNQYLRYDFSRLWRLEQGGLLLGFIGKRYERLQMALLSVNKDSAQPDLYHVIGKSKVSKTITPFSGAIRIQHVWESRHLVPKAVPSPAPLQDLRQRGKVEATYTFREEGKGARAGTFNGRVTSYWLLTHEGQIQYDDLEAGAEGYRNNQFEGEWRSHNGKRLRKANWGDFRIPDSGPLDVGKAQFWPASAFLPYGWKAYVDERRELEEVWKTKGEAGSQKIQSRWRWWE